MTRTLAAAGLGLLLLLPACAERGDAGGTGGAAPTAPGADLPDDADTAILQVSYTGGFVSPETTLGRLPEISVYADGRVVSNGPVAAIYPGPAWPNVQLQQADPGQVRALVARALDAGVGDTADLGTPPVADAPSTRFTVTTTAGTTVREVYALGDGGGPELSPAQQAGRAELAELLGELTDLPATLGSASSYEPTAVAALARPWTAEPDPAVGERAAVAWAGPELPGGPVGADLGCSVATGDQAAAVTAAARAADALTPWQTADGARWAVTFRPLLPGESSCADLVD